MRSLEFQEGNKTWEDGENQNKRFQSCSFGPSIKYVGNGGVKKLVKTWGQMFGKTAGMEGKRMSINDVQY